VVSTVSVPDWAGLIEMLFFLLVILQSPKLPEPPDEEDEEDDPEPQAASDRARLREAARASGRFRCMDALYFSAET
jgi:hypothetical protein